MRALVVYESMYGNTCAIAHRVADGLRTGIDDVTVAPASAISLVSAGEIDVDLSQIQGLDLTSSDTLFVTVSQAGFSDTVEYRYLPGAPGSFNLAP